ncbi:pyridoxamine 5'-phosphate oxidase family protein [Deltaproteobacteria bacterium]|nr:pyridoxamine 5'-phosphate oxidase family protein [Deltaproteobacteria bacterium]
MEFQDCIKFANEYPDVYFATDDSGQPRVRGMSLWFADENGFYFQTQSVKSFCRQLRKNNKVEVCFTNASDGSKPSRIMRVTGQVQFIDDLSFKEKVFEERPFLKTMGIESPEDPILVLFKIYMGEVFFWTLKDSMHESEIERIKF